MYEDFARFEVQTFETFYIKWIAKEKHLTELKVNFDDTHGLSHG